MKKLTILILMLLVTFGIFAQEANSIDIDGHLPRARTKVIQSGRYIQLYGGDNTALEYLNENTFATHTSWTGTNDIVDSGGDAEWTWADAVASTLTQPSDSTVTDIRNGQSLLFTYDVAQSVIVAGGRVTATITGICASTSLDLTPGTGKTVSITTGTAASAADFVLTVKADSDVSAGIIQFDNFYLTSYYESALTIATGSDVTLTVPDNAVEIIINPNGTEVTYKIGGNTFLFDSAHPFPCSGIETIKIGNDSGGTATVYFYFNMI